MATLPPRIPLLHTVLFQYADIETLDFRPYPLINTNVYYCVCDTLVIILYNKYFIYLLFSSSYFKNFI